MPKSPKTPSKDDVVITRDDLISLDEFCRIFRTEVGNDEFIERVNEFVNTYSQELGFGEEYVLLKDIKKIQDGSSTKKTPSMSSEKKKRLQQRNDLRRVIDRHTDSG